MLLAAFVMGTLRAKMLIAGFMMGTSRAKMLTAGFQQHQTKGQLGFSSAKPYYLIYILSYY